MIRSGQRYRWVGLPGQFNDHENEVIVVDSTTASCLVNARLLHLDEPFTKGALVGEPSFTFITIHASDLMTAIDQGWLVVIE